MKDMNKQNNKYLIQFNKEDKLNYKYNNQIFQKCQLNKFHNIRIKWKTVMLNNKYKQ